jgi:hypothetical protein
MFRVNTRDNGGYKHYHDVTAQLRGRLLSAGLDYSAAYRWASSISNIEDPGISRLHARPSPARPMQVQQLFARPRFSATGSSCEG